MKKPKLITMVYKGIKFAAYSNGKYFCNGKSLSDCKKKHLSNKKFA